MAHGIRRAGATVATIFALEVAYFVNDHFGIEEVVDYVGDTDIVADRFCVGGDREGEGEPICSPTGVKGAEAESVHTVGYGNVGTSVGADSDGVVVIELGTNPKINRGLLEGLGRPYPK